MRYAIATILCFLTIVSVNIASAQSYYTMSEYGLAIGESQYFGDLNNYYGLKTLHPSYGVYWRYHLNQFIAVKLVTNITQVGYDDKLNSNPYEKERNLNFQSDIYEGLFQAEFNFFRFATGEPAHRFTPYLTGGFGVFNYNPYTYYSGVKYYLQPLGTEGQNAGYSNRQYTNYSPCFPIGAGFKFWLVGGVNLSIEVADRLTTSSYLDDVSTTYVGINKFPANSVAAILQDRSGEIDPNNVLGRPGKQRGNTSRKDQYMIGIFSLSWHFKSYRCPQGLNDDMIRVRRR
jgi:hypothetical protein